MTSLTRLKNASRHNVDNVNWEAVQQDCQFGGSLLALNANAPGIDLSCWAQNNQSNIENSLHQHGAILFRGFRIDTKERFAQTVDAGFGREQLEYTNRSTPRTQVHGKVYTSTEYPAEQAIPLHNENAYTKVWPGRLFINCQIAPSSGGQTPLANSRRVYSRIDQAVREEFAAKGVRYVRNYGDLDLTWQETFQTDSPEQVEATCKARNIEFAWNGEGQLKTWEVCPGVQDHPVTGDKVWFNQAHLFHYSSLPAEVSSALLEIYEESALPRNAYFGDGSSIPVNYLEHILEAISQEMFMFDWQQGDFILIDNLLTAHGRQPFEGNRLVLVAMTA